MRRAEGRTGPAALAACAARRWLARGAPGVKTICNQTEAAAPACTSLVSCLPALENVGLNLLAPVGREDLGCLLEALAWCPRLTALNLSMCHFGAGEGNADQSWPFPAPALAKLSSLTSLTLHFDGVPYTLAAVVGALVSLTGLVNLSVGFATDAGTQLVPAALGQLKALRMLNFSGMCLGVPEAGCLDLPELQSLGFMHCTVPDAAVLPGVSALLCLTAIEFSLGKGPLAMDPQLAQLPELQRLVLLQEINPDENNAQGPLRLPADMGALSATLLHLDISGHMGTRFPISLTQLEALEHLNANESAFAELPTGITALSRLTELMLGRFFDMEDPLQLRGRRPLDVRALGDLSRFPALCRLTFDWCEVMFCPSMLRAARHKSLASLRFCIAHPAPECAPAVLQLSQELWRLGRGSVLKVDGSRTSAFIFEALQRAQGRAPCQKFITDLEARRLEACGP